MLKRVFGATFEFGDLFGREFVVEIFFANFCGDFILFRQRQAVDLFKNLRRTHGIEFTRR